LRGIARPNLKEFKKGESSADKMFDAKIMNKYSIDYFYCSNCGFLQTQAPYWLEESYKHSINLEDTGILHRNVRLSKITSLLLLFLFKKNDKFLDFAGGYGLFTRLMRDRGLDFYWHDPYTRNLMASTSTHKFRNADW